MSTKFNSVNNWICRAIVNNLIDCNYYAVVCLITSNRNNLSLPVLCKMLKVICALMPRDLVFSDELVNQWYRKLLTCPFYDED